MSVNKYANILEGDYYKEKSIQNQSTLNTTTLTGNSDRDFRYVYKVEDIRLMLPQKENLKITK